MNVYWQTGPPRFRGMFRGIALPEVLCHDEAAGAYKAPFAPRWFFIA